METTTLQKFIVVVMPGTHVHTTVQIFIVVVTQCNGDFPIFIGEDEDQDEDADEGTKSFFKIAQSQICKS